MNQTISDMLESYELGKVSRRQLIQVLAVIAGAAYPARAATSTFQGVALNHVAIRVTNVQRSRDFYQKQFRAPVIHESQSDCFLGLGKNFLTLFQNPNPGLDHFCIAIENFSGDGRLEAPGVESDAPRWHGPGVLPRSGRADRAGIIHRPSRVTLESE